MSSYTPGGPVLGRAGTHWDWLLDSGELCEEGRAKGSGGGGPQIPFKPFVIYSGIYLSLKNNNGMCGTVRPVEHKEGDTLRFL